VTPERPTHLAGALNGLGALLALVGLLDPALQPAGVAGCVVSVAAAAVLRRRGAGHLPVLVAVASAGFVIAALVEPEFRADAPGYYVYLRSMAIDHDLDFADEWRKWGFPDLAVTATGRRPNLYSIGPALLWSPFFALAHAYVWITRVTGLRAWAADGYGTPYLNSMAAGTITAVVAGSYLLARSMHGYLTTRRAAIVVGGAVLTSPIVYYTFVVPGMAHALTFALAAFVVWAWFEAERAPSLRTWCLLGLASGLVALTRWQGLVVGVLPAALAARQLRRRRARPAWIAAAAGAAVLAFLPQMIAWKLLFGRWFTMPQGRAYVDWSSPHFVDVLFSAQRGFFDWTPVMLAGTLGLLLLARAMPTFAAASLAVLVLTAWVNGGVKDWEASDAFGARRFDLAVPLVAWGLAALARVFAGWLQRRPWAAIATILAACAVWNAGFIRLYRVRGFIDAAPVEWLAGAQAHQLYRLLDAGAGRLGPRARALVYNAMVGEYFYYNVNLSGTIDVGAVDSRWLAGGWSDAQRREDWPPFRWALQPQACIRIPLQQPLALRSFIRLRAPARVPVQDVKIISNGVTVAGATFGTEWTDVPFILPAERLHPGLNNVCFEFARRRPGSDEGGYAAAVSLIQLP
jgi:hypothetical protein